MGPPHHLPNIKGLGNLGATCLLCSAKDESRSHFFFNCLYSISLLLPLAELLNHSFWKITNSPLLTLTYLDIRLGKLNQLTEACQKFTHHSPPWGLLWNSVGSFAWYIWSERNRRFKQHTLKPQEVLLREVTMGHQPLEAVHLVILSLNVLV